MIIMQLNGVSKSFGAERILSNIKLEIKDDDRIAIVGRNGAGKSTLLKIMADKLSYDEGQLFKPSDLTIGYLPQHSGLESEQTIWQEMIEVFADLKLQERELRLLEEKLQASSSLSSSESNKLLKDYDRLQQHFITSGGYQYESEVKAVLSGLNFDEYSYDTPIQQLSGGQKTRLSLGKLLLQKPQLLILDEPTNHLDIDTLAWLEGYLTSYPGAIAIVSHDRYFLDKTVSVIYEISHHHTKRYTGSYSKFLTQKGKAYESELKAYEQQQVEIKEMEDFIQRNIARASTTKRAQSRRKQLEAMDKLDRPLGDSSSASFSFQVGKTSGNDVLKVHDLAFRYDKETDILFKNVTFHANRGDRIALVGPNGVGKTTLLKIIIGKLEQEQGNVQIGTNVQIGYYDQEQANLTSAKTVLYELWDDFPLVNETDVRTVLGNFLFSGNDVLKSVSSLSGGEKARLALAKLMMQKANLLILDEPTNHLDIDSKEVLEAALQSFPGTIIFVSHDRYFINKVTDQVAEMLNDQLTVYLGNYDYYVNKKKENIEIEKLQNQEEKEVVIIEEISDSKIRFQEEKRLQSESRRKKRQIKQLEDDIAILEEELAEIELKMTEPEVYEDHEKSLAYSNDSEQLRKQIDQLMEEWTVLHE